MLGVTAADADRWESLFRGRLGRLLTAGKRFSGPRVDTASLWTTSDSTLGAMGAVNWKQKEFIGSKVCEVVSGFLQGEEYVQIIAESELAIECFGFVAWTPVGDGNFVTFLGGAAPTISHGLVEARRKSVRGVTFWLVSISM